MPKKPPKNGYYYFMVDFRRREESAGRRFRGGMAEVAQAADAEWKALPQAEKDDYNVWAKENRHNEEREYVPKKRSAKGRLNSQGVSLALMEKEKKEKEMQERAIRQFVENFVKAKDVDNLKEDEMYLVHVNIFCKTDDEIHYYPAELAICKFNIKDGILATYHTFFDPGEIKKGYLSTLKEHSERFHKITTEFVKQNAAFQNYERIFDEITDFVRNRSVPLFTMYDDVFHNTSLKAVEKTLETLWENKHSAGQELDGWKKHFPVYPLPLLFTQLLNYCYCMTGEPDNENTFPNSTLATQALNKDTYNFRDEFACDFHQREDVIVYCSKSYVQRWAQIMIDYCRQPLKLGTTEMDIECAQTGISNMHIKEELFDEDDKYLMDDDNESVVSGMSCRTARTNLTEASVGFSVGVKKPPSIASGASSSGNAWFSAGRGRGRGRGQRVAPPANDENFPALGGIARGVRNMKL